MFWFEEWAPRIIVLIVLVGLSSAVGCGVIYFLATAAWVGVVSGFICFAFLAFILLTTPVNVET